MFFFFFFKMDIITEEDEEDEILTITAERTRPTALEKLISFISSVIEKAKKLRIEIPHSDYTVVAGKVYIHIVVRVCVIFKTFFN